MKILIISYYFPPINSIASLRPYSWAKFWSQMGHDVTVLTVNESPKNTDLKMDCSQFRTIRITNPFKKYIKQKVSQNSLEVKGATNPRKSIVQKIKFFVQSKGIFATARMPDFNDIIIRKSYAAIKNETFDIAVSTAGPYSEHLIGYNLKKNGNIKFWIVDYRDLWTQNHIFKGLFPFTLIEEYLESKINTSADLITTVSEPLAQQIRNKYDLDNVDVIPNGFDFDDLDTLDPKPYWNDGKKHLVYTGAIYQGKQDPSPLFEAIKQLYHSPQQHLLEHLRISFVGGFKADLHTLIELYNVATWVKDDGFVSREDALRMQRDANGVIFLEFEASGVEGILTGKLFEYLALGREIIGIGVTNASSSGRLIQECGYGRNFGTDVEVIIQYLIELLSSTEPKKCEKNMLYLEQFSRKKQAEKLLSLAKKIYK
jgi:glycosyltransferase involved in cell wall biosynthesis